MNETRRSGLYENAISVRETMTTRAYAGTGRRV